MICFRALNVTAILVFLISSSIAYATVHYEQMIVELDRALQEFEAGAKKAVLEDKLAFETPVLTVCNAGNDAASATFRAVKMKLPSDIRANVEQAYGEISIKAYRNAVSLLEDIPRWREKVLNAARGLTHCSR